MCSKNENTLGINGLTLVKIPNNYPGFYIICEKRLANSAYNWYYNHIKINVKLSYGYFNHRKRIWENGLMYEMLYHRTSCQWNYGTFYYFDLQRCLSRF